MKIKYIAIMLLLLSAAPGAAAQDLSTEITVDRTVVTELPAAAPLPSVFPAMSDNSSSLPGISPERYSRWTDFTSVPLNPDRPLHTGINAAGNHRGYVFGGYFPSYNAEFAAGFRPVDTKSTQLGAAIRFDGSSYKPDYFRYRDNTIRGQVDVSHTLSGGMRIFADADYLHAALRRPGRQHLDGFRISMGVAGTEIFSASAAFDCFGAGDNILESPAGIWKPAKDRRFTAQAAVGLGFGYGSNSAFDFGVRADILRREYAGNYGGAIRNRNDTPVLFDLMPGLKFTGGRFRARVGIAVNIGVRTGQKAFFVAPDVVLAWLPAGVFDAYANFGGGRTFRGLRWQWEACPFAVGADRAAITRSPVDARVGLNVRPLSGLHLGIYAGYSAWRNLPVFASVDAREGTGEAIPAPYNFEMTDLCGWNCGAEASYEVADLGDIHFDGKYFRKGDPALADRAKATAKIGLTLRLTGNLTVTGDYNIRACRRYISNEFIRSAYTGEVTARINRNADLRNISDVSLGANYAFSQRFSAYARLENILGRRHLLIPGIESKTFHGLVGASFTF